MHRAAGLVGKTTLVLGAFGTCAVAISILVAVATARNILLDDAWARLDALAGIKTEAIADWFDEHLSHLRSLSAMEKLTPGETDAVSLARLGSWMSNMPSIDKILALDAETGRVYLSSDPTDVGKFKEDRPFFIAGRKGPVSGIAYYSVTDRRPVMYASMPIRDAEGNAVAVLAGRLDVSAIEKVVTLGRASFTTLDAYLVNEFRQYLSQPRFIKGGAVLKQINSSSQVTRCLTGKDGHAESVNYRGTPVFARYSWLADHRMCLLVEMDRSEVFAGVDVLLARMAGFGVAIVFLLLAVAVLVGKGMVRPLLNLTNATKSIAKGDLSVRVDIERGDEIGALAEAFNSMVKRIEATEQSFSEQTAQLSKTNQELEQFAYVASHDLKAPLRGIDNLTEWIAEDIGDSADDDTRDNLKLLRGRVHRMGNLLDDLLQYSRAGRKQHSLETVDTGSMVRNVVDLLNVPPGFEVRISESMPIMRTQRVPLEQVFRNLINNAIKHHDRSEGAVTIECEKLDGSWMFTVSDDGPGIPPEYHETVFQMFRTLRPRDEVEGSGMGLALVRKIVDTGGGEIALESKPEARGTLFRFTWKSSEESTDA